MSLVILMVLLAGVLVVGLGLTLAWGATPYRPADPAAPPGPAGAARRYLRGVTVVLVAGFWTGLLVTGPAVRLAMRLLAVTGGESAQRRITEADEVVGAIDLGGTVGLVLFGGVLPGLLSAAIYVVLRPVLPAGRLGGVAFGLAHLVVAATRLDPLRPGNPDFDIVGPGWLAVATFGLASIAHGMAVVAFANRWTQRFPSVARSRSAQLRTALPLVPGLLLLVPGAAALLPLAAGLVVAVALSLVPRAVATLRSRPAVTTARVAAVVVVLALLPGTVGDLWDVVDRDRARGAAASARP